MARATAHEVFNSVMASARAELDRSSLGLAFSGLSAGLNIGFSFVAVAAVLGIAGAGGSGALLAAVAYPVGFIIIILARAQLFTENTLTPVLLVLDEFTRENLLNTLRLWGVVLASNLLGAFLFSLLLAEFRIAPHIELGWLVAAARAAYEGAWGEQFVRGLLGGWLIAIMVWTLHVGESALAEIVLVWIAAFLIQLAGFSHSIAGAVEVLFLAHQGVITYLDWLLRFQIPVTLGNIAGGVVFVSLVNYAQVVGAGHDVEVAERREELEAAKGES